MDPVRVRGRRGSKVPCEAHGFKGLRCRRFLKVPKVLGRHVLELKAPRVKGFKTYGNTSYAIPRAKRGSRVNISKTHRVSRAQCFNGTEDPRASGFQGTESFPLLTRAFNEIGVSKIQGFQGNIYI